MKRVRCPKCDHFITFDETKYTNNQSLIFVCPECNKQFGIKLGKSKLFAKEQKAAYHDEEQGADSQQPIAHIVVIENVFHYKQVIPLHMGDNVIGRYQKGNPINCPIETVDPSVDLNHCTINVSMQPRAETKLAWAMPRQGKGRMKSNVCRTKRGDLRFTLSDNNSNTGTFVDNVELTPKERRIITNGSLFTIGATSIILKTEEEE